MTQALTTLLILSAVIESILSAARLPPASSNTFLSNETDSMSSKQDFKHRYAEFWPDDVQIGCTELRAKRFISDGFCTSIKPIKEVVCAGHCLPIKEQNLPWWSEFTKIWAKPKLKEWRCVEAVTKLKKVQLMCENGEIRTYKIKVVKSCRCKNFDKRPNRTDNLEQKKRRRRHRRKVRKDKDKDKSRRNKRDKTAKRNNDRKRERRRKDKHNANSDSQRRSREQLTIDDISAVE